MQVSVGGFRCDSLGTEQKKALQDQDKNESEYILFLGVGYHPLGDLRFKGGEGWFGGLTERAAKEKRKLFFSFWQVSPFFLHSLSLVLLCLLLLFHLSTFSRLERTKVDRCISLLLFLA